MTQKCLMKSQGTKGNLGWYHFVHVCTCTHTFTRKTRHWSDPVDVELIEEWICRGILATILYEPKAQELELCLRDRLRFPAASSWNWNVPSRALGNCHSTRILLDYVILGALIVLKTSHHPENPFQSSELGCPVYGCWQSMTRAINYHIV